MKLSIVVPMYNEEEIIAELFSRVERLLERLALELSLKRDEVEIIWVNDGSTDGTFDKLKEISQKHEGYVLVNLSRNHGHQLAITAGIDQATGEAVAIMDGDLQDPPEFIVDLYSKLREGYDVVYAIREKREGEGWFKLITASWFYSLLRRLTSVDIPADTGDFRVMSRRVVDALSTMRERHRFMRGMVSWVGLKQTGIKYVRAERFAGHTKYYLAKMVKFAIDGIVSFSVFPLKLVTYLGFATACLGSYTAFT